MMDEGTRLRREVMAHGPRTRGARLPGELRRRIAEYAAAERAHGVTMREIAARTGVSHESIRLWMRGLQRVPRETTALVPVVVREMPVMSESAISVIAPGGYRVVGLTVEMAADLLRALA